MNVCVCNSRKKTKEARLIEELRDKQEQLGRLKKLLKAKEAARGKKLAVESVKKKKNRQSD
jgi:hypothetical protein